MEPDPTAKTGRDSTVNAPQPPPDEHSNNTPAPHAPPAGDSFVNTRPRAERTDRAFRRTQSVPGGITPTKKPIAPSPPPFPAYNNNLSGPPSSAAPSTTYTTPQAGPSSASGYLPRAPGSNSDSSAQRDSNSLANSSPVRVGRDIPQGALSTVQSEQDIVDIIADVCKTKRIPLDKAIAQLTSRLDATEDHIDAEIDRRYQQHSVHHVDPAISNRLSKIEDTLRAYGKRPATPPQPIFRTPQRHAKQQHVAFVSPVATNQATAVGVGSPRRKLLADAALAEEHPNTSRESDRHRTRTTSSERRSFRRDSKRRAKLTERSRRRHTAGHSRKSHESHSERHQHSCSSSSCSEHSDASSEHSYVSDENLIDDGHDVSIAFPHREMGPRHAQVRVLKSADPEYDRLMNYRYYRLLRRNTGRTADSTIAVRKHLKSLDVTMKDYKFDGTDPVLVFDFLTRLAEEADAIGMNESQAFMALPHYLTGVASKRFRAASHSGTVGGITNWPQAVNHLLQTYATPAAIRQAKREFRSLTQRPNEDELDFSARVSESAYRCGNVMTEVDRMAQFVDGLHVSTRSLVARHRERTPRDRLTYTDLAQFAQDEGDAYRGRQPSLKPVRATPEQALVVNPDDENDCAPPDNTDNQHQGHYDDSPPPQDEELHYMRHQSITKPASIAHGGPTATPNRVGWVNRRPLICFACYARDVHTSPNCDLRAADLPKVIINYESLTDEEKEWVPDAAYKAACEHKAVSDRLHANRATADPAKASPIQPTILRNPASTAPSNIESKK